MVSTKSISNNFNNSDMYAMVMYFQIYIQWLCILLYTLIHNFWCKCIYSYIAFIYMVLCYNYKFSNMGISKIFKIIYSYGCFL